LIVAEMAHVEVFHTGKKFKCSPDIFQRFFKVVLEDWVNP
jgi:hypothetical protein